MPFPSGGTAVTAPATRGTAILAKHLTRPTIDKAPSSSTLTMAPVEYHPSPASADGPLQHAWMFVPEMAARATPGQARH